MKGNDTNNKAGNLQYSKSAELLHSRLVAEVKVPSNAGMNKSASGLTLKPRIPAMHTSKSTALIGLENNAISFNEILPSPVQKQLQDRETFNGASTKALSISAGLTGSNPFTNNPEPFSESKRSGTIKKDFKSTQNTTQSTAALTSYGIDPHGFIASLNLTPKQLHELFKVPQTFFYLTQINLDDIENDAAMQIQPTAISETDSDQGSISSDKGQTKSPFFDARNYTIAVYDLKQVNLDQIDKNHYFTISKEGITQFHNKVSTFTSLIQWDREYKLYHKIANIQFFKLYKRWKVINYLSFILLRLF